MLKLYHNDMSSCAQKVRITLAEKDLAWESIHLSLRKGETRTDEYKKMNPLGVVPTLITEDGTIIIESTVILEYLDDAYGGKPLKPDDPIEGSAYDLPFSLHRFLYEAIDAFESSEAMRSTLGDKFVDLYSEVKKKECHAFQEIVTPWEREVLMFNV